MMSSFGSTRRSSRTTVSPPRPESNTPSAALIGASYSRSIRHVAHGAVARDRDAAIPFLHANEDLKVLADRRDEHRTRPERVHPRLRKLAARKRGDDFVALCK